VLISLHMALTALVGLFFYKVTKQLSGRERPYVVHADRIECAMAPLDRYSFPSGHTLHAVSFSMMLCSYFPQMTWVLLPFAILVGLSHMILGLHYPGDVLAGAFIGAVRAGVSFDLLTFAGVQFQ
jgi:undecaprenyl-diphosphatase